MYHLQYEHEYEAGGQEHAVTQNGTEDAAVAHFLYGGGEEFDDGDDDEQYVGAPEVVVGAYFARRCGRCVGSGILNGFLREGECFVHRE